MRSSSLYTRSIILMSIPLVFQLLFVLAMTLVLQQAEAKLEKQWQSENLIKLTFSLCRDSSDLLLWLHVPSDFRGSIGPDINEAWLARARHDIDRLGKLAQDDPQKRGDISKMLYSSSRIFEVLEEALARIRAGNDRPVDFREVFNKFGAIFYDSVDNIVAIEKQRKADSNLYGVAISTVYSVLAAAVALSIVVAIALGFAYAISIRKPLKHLSENGKLLSARKLLLPPLSTGDQFGELDAMLHATAREINSTLQRERETIENAADLICTVDEKGFLVTVNPFASKMLGLAQDQLQGKPLHELTASEQSLLADEFIRKAVTSFKTEQFELLLKHADGHMVDTRWSCLWSASEQKLFCVVRDVTEEKRIEQLKQDFTNMISHDLRSPLMAMGNALTLLQSGAKGEIPEEARVRVETSGRNVEKLIVLVNDLLDFQKLKAGKMELILEPVSLQSVIRDAADLVEGAAREKAIKIELPEGETIVECDRSKLMQTAVNLISNAIKFSGRGETVSINVDNDGEKVLFSVKDTGPGVPPQFQEKIFEPFEQAPSGKKNEGTGLGLAICKLVVEAHGGKIHIANCCGARGGRYEKLSEHTGRNSEAGNEESFGQPLLGGSIFTVELPLTAKEADS